MVVADQRHGLAQPAEVRHDVRAVYGVASHDRKLVVVERAGLRQDAVRHRDLADVVKQAAEAHRIDPVRRQTELLGDRDRDALHARGVPRRVGILGVDRRVQALDRLERALLEPPVRVHQLA